MNKFNNLLIKNKKRALSLAVATAFLVANPLSLTGCSPKYDPYSEEEEEYDDDYSGGGFRIHSSKRSSSYKSGKSGSKSSSSYKSSSKGKSSSSSYSGSRGGRSSS